jgi:hypothetical protein
VYEHFSQSQISLRLLLSLPWLLLLLLRQPRLCYAKLTMAVVYCGYSVSAVALVSFLHSNFMSLAHCYSRLYEIIKFGVPSGCITFCRISLKWADRSSTLNLRTATRIFEHDKCC